MKAFTITTYLMSACLVMNTACRKHEPSGTELPSATVSLSLILEETAETRAVPSVSEAMITDLNLFVYYSRTGQLAEYAYIENPGGNVELSVISGTGLDIYAIANAGDLTGTPGITDSLGLTALTWDLESPQDIVNIEGAIPMSGRLRDVEISDGMPLTIPLTRLLSKFRIIADTSGLDKDITTFDIKKAVIRNMNRRTGYFRPGRASTEEEVFSEGLCMEGEELKALFGSGVDFYLPENAQGDLLSSNVDEKTHIPPAPYDGLCTFVELHVDYRSTEHYNDSLVYRYYLHDGRRLDNFDLLRNTMYTCRTHFTGTGINEQTWRIDISGMKDLVTSITVDPSERTFRDAGETFRFSATVLPASAEDPSVVWSSDNEDVAAVSADGTVTAVSDGTCRITATAADGSGVSGSATVIVDTYKFPESVIVSPEQAELYTGEQITLSAEVLPENAGNKQVKWLSTDPDKASVSEDGTVTALSAGMVEIIAVTEESSLRDTAVLRIKNRLFYLMKVPDIIYPNYNSPVTVAYIAQPEAEPVLKITLIKGDADAVSVSDGVITATNPGVSSGEIGSYTLHATANGITVSRDFSVSAGKIILPPMKVMNPKEQFKINPFSVSPADIGITWSSSDPETATVSSDGTVTAVAPGSCTITAETDAGARDEVTVEVSMPSLNFIESPLRIYEGESITLTSSTVPPSSFPVEYSVVSGSEFVSISGDVLQGLKRSSGQPNPVIQVRFKDSPDIYKRAEVIVLPCISAELEAGYMVVNTHGHSSMNSNWNNVIPYLPVSVEHAPHVSVQWEIRDEDGNLRNGYFNVEDNKRIVPASPDATGRFTITGKDQTGKYTTAPITIESYQMLEYEVGLSEYSFVSVGNTQYYVVSLSARWHADSWRFMSGYLQNVFIQQELIMHRQDHVQFSNIGSNGSDETYIAGYVTSIRRSGAGVVSDLKGLIPMSWIRTDMKEGSGSVQGIVGSFLIFNTEDNGFDGYYYIKQRSESFYNTDEYI